MKTDFKKSLACYTARRGKFDIVDVPPLRYVMVDGRGDPNTEQSYADAISAVYPVAYALKFFSKNELGRDYVVMPLEALWWASNMDVFTAERDKSQWNWTVLNMVPDWIEQDMFDTAVAESTAKRHNSIDVDLRMETLREGRCVQTLHVGSYDDEAEVLRRLHDEFIPAAGATMTGRHHEIYLSDPRRVDPAKLRTILRQPIEDVKVSSVDNP